MKTHLTVRFAQLSAALVLLGVPALKADLAFHVDLNTSALADVPNAPFYLDFQLNEGSGILPNTVVLSDFTFDHGSASGAASVFGAVTGDLSETVSLTDSSSSPFNEFFQAFTPGTTDIQFDVTVSQQAAGATPDGFFAAILDSEAGFPQIATNAPDGVSLIALDLGPSATLSDVGNYSGLSPTGVTTAISAVPEPSSYAWAAAAVLAGIVMLRRRKLVVASPL